MRQGAVAAKGDTPQALRVLSGGLIVAHAAFMIKCWYKKPRLVRMLPFTLSPGHPQLRRGP